MHCGPDGHSLSPLGLPTRAVALAPAALASGASRGTKPMPATPACAWHFLTQPFSHGFHPLPGTLDKGCVTLSNGMSFPGPTSAVSHTREPASGLRGACGNAGCGPPRRGSDQRTWGHPSTWSQHGLRTPSSQAGPRGEEPAGGETGRD